MKKSRVGLRLLVVGAVSAVFLSCFADGTAHAYVDPGSGSQFVQVLIASLVGLTYALKLSWSRITKALKKCVRRSDR